MVSSQELETILNHSRDAFLLADNEGRILFFNSAIEELSGFSLKKYLGKNLKLLVNKGLISYSTALEAIEKKQTITGKIETYKGKKQLVTSVPVINRSGSLDRVVCNIRGLSIIQEKVMQNSFNTVDLDTIKLKEKTINYGINKFYNLIEIEGCDDGLVYKDRPANCCQ
jgi:PAS domain S-box-containing protein